jgi:VIT1/CCC1 family predicted Fe2+/Mn2+ transporter
MSRRFASHKEGHRAHRGGWLRAGVLGANDGIVSTASLVLGVAAANGTQSAVLVAGLAGLVGGSLSMAAGEYVSVSSQRDVEESDLAREGEELRTMPGRELAELAGLYVAQGLPLPLARQVAEAVTERDGLAAHAREELNIDVNQLARPIQAAASSAVSFAVGAVLPLAAMLLSDGSQRLPVTLGAAIAALTLLGGWSARLGGAPVLRAVARVVVGGGAAMGLTMLIGAWVGSL